MNEKMADVFEHWLQGRINTCVSGLLSRIEHLEVDNDNLKEVVNLLAPRVARMDDEVKYLSDKIKGTDRQASSMLHMLDGYGKQLCNLKIGGTSVERFDALMREWAGEFGVEPLLKALRGSADWEESVSNAFATVEFNDAVKEAVGEMSLEIRVS